MAVPRRLGPYHVLGLIGRGGMGEVYEAIDPRLGRRLAIKVMAATGTDESWSRRFLAEARITSQLEHPSIVPIYDVGREADLLWLAMRRVDGHALSQVLEDAARSADWPLERLLGAFVQVCGAVAYAHEQGVLHRDIKPDNIMLGRFGEVQVLDWGVAGLVGAVRRRTHDVRVSEGGRARITRDGDLVGTPGYMPPEQAFSELGPPDVRSDVWGLGAVLYEIVLRRRAWPQSEVNEYLAALWTEQDPSDSSLTASQRMFDPVLDVALRALSYDPGSRFESAAALGEAVRAFLDGRERRSRASHFLRAAQGAWEEWAQVAEAKRLLEQRESELVRRIDRWAPLESKSELLRVRERLRDLGPEREELFGRAVAEAERALSQDPSSAIARGFLSRAYWRRFEEAEQAGDRSSQRYYESRVRTYDDGSLTSLLTGTGAVTLHTDPPGAEVLVEKVVRRGLVWTREKRFRLGKTPIDKAPLEMGSYLMTARAPGKAPTRYPVRVDRGCHWSSGHVPVPLYSPQEIGGGFVYVPPGPYLRGGDAGAVGAASRAEVHVPGFFVAQLPVTVDQWCFWVNDLLDRGWADAAWAAVPHREASVGKHAARYWPRLGGNRRYQPPILDRDGDAWEADWPIVAVSLEQVQEFVQWRSDLDSVQYQLPTEDQWEKAARGVDGRVFPWGDEFDPTLCTMNDSVRGRARVQRVDSRPEDVSIYGVRDVAGGVRQWCSDSSFEGDRGRRPVRGGSWAHDARYCRLASRTGASPQQAHGGTGVRLVRALPLDGGAA